MKRISRCVLMLWVFFIASPAESNQTELQVKLKDDLIGFVTKSWDEYSLKEYFEKKPRKFDYLNKTFTPLVVDGARKITESEFNLEETVEDSIGYSFGIILLEYKDVDAAKKILTAMENPSRANLKGGMVFIGFTIKRCKNVIALVYSSGVVTKLVKSYFAHFNKDFSC